MKHRAEIERIAIAKLQRKGRSHEGIIVTILLQKSFGGDERKFSGTLTRVTRCDVRDHVVPGKNDHGPA